MAQEWFAGCLTTIPEILIENDGFDQSPKSPTSPMSPEKRSHSIEDEGYGSERYANGIHAMLDDLAEMSRRLSVAPSDEDFDQGLEISRKLSVTSLQPSSSSVASDFSEPVELFWQNVRVEVAALRKSRDDAHAQATASSDELAAQTKRVDQLEADLQERDEKIAQLERSLATEKHASKQLQETIQDLLAWIEKNGQARHEPKPPAPAQTSVPPSPPPPPPPPPPLPPSLTLSSNTRTSLSGLKTITSAPSYMHGIPTYTIAFRPRSSSSSSSPTPPPKTVTVWKVQFVQSYSPAPTFFSAPSLPSPLRNYIRFLQLWCLDDCAVYAREARHGPMCIWCVERGKPSVWTNGGEGLRACRECMRRGRWCFAVVPPVEGRELGEAVLRCLPAGDWGSFGIWERDEMGEGEREREREKVAKRNTVI
jgi:hypothetical protein